MCGIAGYVLRNTNADREIVRAMCDRIRHRGPDDEGFYVDGGCAIGMRRLSIIDLATGHQPISNEDGSIWIVFNGEIYDYQELRRRLLERGHRFSTNTDTEVLVHLYEDEGIDGLERLRGMFAFAIWDAPRRKLFIARDRFGKKPLYYAETPDGLYFASEIKCLRAAGVPLAHDEEALRLYFQLGYIPDPFSAFRAIRKLPPASWLVYDGRSVKTGRYWKPPAAAPAPAPAPQSYQEACRRLRTVFDEAVRIRMIADVPLGAFLSGGIDSSSVVASMALQSPDPVRTFSIGFEEAAYNELEHAAAVAREYKTEHHEILVRPDSVELVERLVRHFDEPFGDSSAIPTFIVSEFARRHVTVALSGDGGDELFAGYDRFAEAGKIERLGAIPRPARGLLSWISGRLPYRAYGRNYLHMLSRASSMERYLERNFAPYAMRRQLLRDRWMLPADSAYFESTFAEYLLPDSPGLLSAAMYFETMVNLPGDMLVKVDRMSMANSLEVRCPLLDQELAEVAASVPYPQQLHKRFLLDAIGDRLPPSVTNRPKMGFGVPLAAWFRGSLRAYLWDHLTGQRFLARGYVSEPFLRYLLTEHDTGRRDNSQWLWRLLMLELWERELEKTAN